MRQYAVFIVTFAVFSHVTDGYNWHSRNHGHGDWHHHGGGSDSSQSDSSRESSSSEEYYGGDNNRNWHHRGQDYQYQSGHNYNWRPPNFHPHGYNTYNLRPEFNGNRFNRQTTVTTQSPAVALCIRNCPVTSEFNPICGTDNVTYTNIGRLTCAQRCGVVVEIRRNSTCAVANALGFTIASPNGNNVVPTSPTPPNIQQCISLCPQIEEMRPVCGSDGVTYRNPSAILCAQMCGLDVRATKLSACSAKNPLFPQPLSPSVSTCIQTCPSTAEYNPVCGTNGVTYQNPSYLQCVRNCGVNVEIRRRAPCSSSSTNENVQTTVKPSPSPTQLSLAVQYCIKSCISTSEFSPVCGTNSVTYDNLSKLQCAKKCGVTVDLLHRRPCPSPTLPNEGPNGNGNNVPSPVISTTTPPRKPTIIECLASCPQSEIYKPICGTNNFTFNNADHLLCAQLCGIDVQIQQESPCTNSERTSEPSLPITPGTTQKPLDPITNNINPEPVTLSIDLINSLFPITTTIDPTEDIDERLGDTK